MKIAVLGSGCLKCRQTYEVVLQAVERAGSAAEVMKIEDFREMAKYKVMMTPAVAIDGTIRIAGRIPTVEEIAALIEANGDGKG
jgi:small redox-active disulfide protein 2